MKKSLDGYVPVQQRPDRASLRLPAPDAAKPTRRTKTKDIRLKTATTTMKPKRSAPKKYVDISFMHSEEIGVLHSVIDRCPFPYLALQIR